MNEMTMFKSLSPYQRGLKGLNPLPGVKLGSSAYQSWLRGMNRYLAKKQEELTKALKQGQ